MNTIDRFKPPVSSSTKVAQLIPVWKRIGRPLLSMTSVWIAWCVGEMFFHIRGFRRSRNASDVQDIESILLTRLDDLGDVVMTTPLFRELRRLFPRAWITLVVQPRLRNLVEQCPYVNEVLTYDSDSRKPFRRLRLHYHALQLARKRLWNRHFDLAIVPRWHADAQHMSFIAYFSGARRRLAFSESVNSYKRNLNRGYNRLFTDLLYDTSVQHQVRLGLSIIDYLGGKPQDDKLELWSTHEDEAFVQTLLANAGARKGEMLIAFGAGARRPKRAWPLTRFIQLGQWLAEHYGVRIVGVGGAEEEGLGFEIQNHLGNHFINAVGKTTLRQSYCLLRHCILFVGNDTGSKHLAAAAGVPVVETSWLAADALATHLESPDRFHAWGVPFRIVRPPHPRKPCTEGCSSNEAHCILGVDLEMVERAVKGILPTTNIERSPHF